MVSLYEFHWKNRIFPLGLFPTQMNKRKTGKIIPTSWQIKIKTFYVWNELASKDAVNGADRPMEVENWNERRSQTPKPMQKASWLARKNISAAVIPAQGCVRTARMIPLYISEFSPRTIWGDSNPVNERCQFGVMHGGENISRTVWCGGVGSFLVLVQFRVSQLHTFVPHGEMFLRCGTLIASYKWTLSANHFS
jgi:hypothetical protein